MTTRDTTERDENPVLNRTPEEVAADRLAADAAEVEADADREHYLTKLCAFEHWLGNDTSKIERELDRLQGKIDPDRERAKRNRRRMARVRDWARTFRVAEVRIPYVKGFPVFIDVTIVVDGGEHAALLRVTASAIRCRVYGRQFGGKYSADEKEILDWIRLGETGRAAQVAAEKAELAAHRAAAVEGRVKITVRERAAMVRLRVPYFYISDGEYQGDWVDREALAEACPSHPALSR